ncbi:FKBP-type peptidyl-prolyl cis-trans isomerase [Solitalea koreensis]|uniref:Peptidyl-prolyl cis-trans isomerase n=1 Tax=Solitalea koreensis TaxID=543615 RepID=A0A521AH74_9SPHI|nr:peptidylprolyl isomerase [Solitalea koreensis]SMO34164.1 FKBP-type peptidyl prolyl cis-trans isomerase /Apo-metallochaperone SlyD [Solitalea koreensis]
METIKNGKVVGISYTLTNDKKDVLDQSQPGQPLEYLHGSYNIIPGLEKELEGLKIGDAKLVEVAPADGYGEFDESLVFAAPRQNFPSDAELEVGMQFQTMGDGQPMVIRIIELDGDKVVVDGNHPLAGQTLFFDVKVESMREASESEVAHGHVHPDGGEHH